MNKIQKIIANFFKYLLIWEIGGITYYTVEILFRGYSHESMFILGGLCLVFIGLLNEIFSFNMYFELQVIIGDIIVVGLEFVTGLIVNIWLGLGVWDYSNIPFNFMGQVCLLFALLWIPVIVLAIVVDDWIRYEYLGEEEPSYKSWIKEKFFTKKKAIGK